MSANKDEIEQVGRAVIKSTLKVHSTLGPGLLEGAYELCLAYEVRKAGFNASRQVSIPICYDQLRVDSGYRIDLLVEGLVVVELKALEAILPVHRYQVLSYLRLGGYRLGYLLNFNVAHMRDGITRLVNHL